MPTTSCTAHSNGCRGITTKRWHRKHARLNCLANRKKRLRHQSENRRHTLHSKHPLNHAMTSTLICRRGNCCSNPFHARHCMTPHENHWGLRQGQLRCPQWSRFDLGGHTEATPWRHRLGFIGITTHEQHLQLALGARTPGKGTSADSDRPTNPPGYAVQVRSHNAVAASVSQPPRRGRASGSPVNV